MIEGVFKTQNSENVPKQAIDHRTHTNKDKKEAADTVKTKDANKDYSNDVQGAIERVVDAAKFFNRKIHLEVETDLGITVVKVVDSDSGKVVRQIPPEELVELSRRAKDLKGLLVSKEE